MRVCEDLGKSGRERFHDHHVADALLVSAQGERFAYDMIEIDHRARRVALAREREQVAYDPCGALGLCEDGLDALGGCLLRGVCAHALGPGENCRERVVQLVSDARNCLSERGEFFGLQQLVVDILGLIVEILALAHIPDQRFDGPSWAVRFGQGRDFHPER
jgi:hypothetical protein